MKFIYTEGKYHEFRGYVFSYGQPTTVTDQATIDLLLARDDFKPLAEATKEDAQTQPASEVQASTDADTCPKCGRYVKQGRYLHIKFCKGK